LKILSPIKELEFGDGMIDAPNLGIPNPIFRARCCVPATNKRSSTPSNTVSGSKRTGLYFDLKEMCWQMRILWIVL
jgi:hypothetical protein